MDIVDIVFNTYYIVSTLSTLLPNSKYSRYSRISSPYGGEKKLSTPFDDPFLRGLHTDIRVSSTKEKIRLVRNIYLGMPHCALFESVSYTYGMLRRNGEISYNS